MKKRHIFDFDGVLMDSVCELAVSTYNAVTAAGISSTEELPRGYLERFRVNRSFGHDPYEMVLIARWVLEGLNGPSKTITKADQGDLRLGSPERGEITKDFFECRAKLVEREKELWLQLNQPFQPIWGHLREHLPYELLIVTTKNRVAVLDLCAYYELPVDPKNIYAGDDLASKSDHFLSLSKRFPGETLEFLEDSVENLLMLRKSLPKEVCPELLVARWGYLSPEQLESAEKEGFKTFQQEEFLRHANFDTTG